MNLNKIFILGRLTRDPEARSLPSGQTVVTFGMATNRGWTDQSGNRQEATEFHNIVVFGKLADICSQYLSKGRLVLIEGRIQTRSWDDQQSGTKRYKTEIVAENMQMGPRPGESGSREPSQNQQNQPTSAQEDIPVIESEEPIADSSDTDQNADQPEKQETQTADTNENTDQQNKNEVNVNDIPF